MNHSRACILTFTVLCGWLSSVTQVRLQCQLSSHLRHAFPQPLAAANHTLSLLFWVFPVQRILSHMTHCCSVLSGPAVLHGMD